MKMILSLALLALSMGVTTPAFAEKMACLKGDTLAGPNCVHVDQRPMRDPMTTVYRVTGKEAKTVWFGTGTLKKSTVDYIIIVEPVMGEDGKMHQVEVRYDWTGTAYEER